MLLRYEPETGALFWCGHGRGIRRGQKAGSVSSVRGHRYRYVSVDGRKYLVQHVAWLLMTKRWPDMPITFKDGNSLNMRWRNLRPATITYIRAHAKLRSDNSSGHKGVSWHMLKRKWTARIWSNKEQHSLGYHHIKADAVKARRRGARARGYPR